MKSVRFTFLLIAGALLLAVAQPAKAQSCDTDPTVCIFYQDEGGSGSAGDCTPSGCYNPYAGMCDPDHRERWTWNRLCEYDNTGTYKQCNTAPSTYCESKATNTGLTICKTCNP
jgi:hypothetical protein